MTYNKGEVIIKKGLRFLDNDEPDPKGQRPVMIMLAVSEDNKYEYFLSLTSKTQKYFDNRLKSYYALVKKNENNRLKASSLVNLQNIYKVEVGNEPVTASIEEDDYRNIIRRFKSCQEADPKKYSNEIKDLLNISRI